MGAPTIDITFKRLANATIATADQGTLAIILKTEDAEAHLYRINKASEIPEGIDGENRAYVERGLMGNETAPRKLLLWTGSAVADGLAALAAERFDWLAGPPEATKEEAEAIVAHVKTAWEEDRYIRAVVAGAEAPNHPGIVLLHEDSIVCGGKTYAAAACCSRIAGAICGTGKNGSITYMELPEVDSVQAKTRAERDAIVDAGKLGLYHDGEKVKVIRGVTSLTTPTGVWNDAYKKIRLVDVICAINRDLRTAIEDNYIGKLPNTADNRFQLVAGVEAYLQKLEADGAIAAGSTAEIDVDAARAYLASTGEDVSDRSDEDVLLADTGSHVFVRVSLHMIDAIEDVTVTIYH